MSAHFEIVRTDADQPWHARLIVNAEITWRTENLTRKVGAERAILSLARIFGWVDPDLGKWSVTESSLLDSRPDGPNAVTVEYVDERPKP